jgi:4-hydroxy 2-oxovalerate aldolase
MELLLSFLKNPKFKLRPVIEAAEKVFVPLRKKMDWGYSIPYLITGYLNEHPRPAMKIRESDKPDEYLAFFDQMVEKE